MAQVSLYCYCRPADGILDSEGPLSLMIAPSVLTKVNLLPLARRKQTFVLPFTTEKKVRVAQCGSVNEAG